MAKMKFLLSEKIDRAREGRSQTWIVNKMNELGAPISEPQFSRKKKGHQKFSEKELEILSQVLETELN